VICIYVPSTQQRVLSGKLVFPLTTHLTSLHVCRSIMRTFATTLLLALAAIPTLSHPLDTSNLRARSDEREALHRRVPVYLRPRRTVSVNVQAEAQLANSRATTQKQIQNLQDQLAAETATLRGGGAAKTVRGGKGKSAAKGGNMGTLSNKYSAPDRRIPMGRLPGL
jgi:hypothetical protein